VTKEDHLGQLLPRVNINDNFQVHSEIKQNKRVLNAVWIIYNEYSKHVCEKSANIGEDNSGSVMDKLVSKPKWFELAFQGKIVLFTNYVCYIPICNINSTNSSLADPFFLETKF
jgi:hypothetical protein